MGNQSFVGVLLSWAPMLLLIGVWIYFFRAGGGRTKHIQLLEEYRDEMRTTNRHLERIAVVLEKR